MDANKILQLIDDIIFIINEKNEVLYQNKKIDYNDFHECLVQQRNILYNPKTYKFYSIQKIIESNNTIIIYKNITNEIKLKMEIQELEKKASRDQLTMLYNRNKMTQELQAIDKMQLMEFTKIYLVMIDLDNFKKINDTYGHPIGDIVLKELSKIFTNFIKEPNIISRYGGEEFTIIFKDKTEDEVLETMEKIRKTVETTTINNIISCTISIGISEYKENYVMTIKEADDALYHIKNNGKNGICYSKNGEKRIYKQKTLIKKNN